MTALRILEVTLEIETAGPTHQVLRLTHGQWAVAWRQIAYAEGDYLPEREVKEAYLDHGAILQASQAGAERLAIHLAASREKMLLSCLLGVLRSADQTTH